MPMSNQYPWEKTGQTRCSHLVDKAIEIFTAAPRPTEDLNVAACVHGEKYGHPYLVVEGGVPCFYRPHKLPLLTKDPFPIILATIRARVFILDGAHRLARWKLAGQATIPAIRLTPEESIACIRPGMEKRLEELDLDAPV